MMRHMARCGEQRLLQGGPCLGEWRAFNFLSGRPVTSLPTKSQAVALGGKVVAEPRPPAAALETAWLSFLLPQRFGVRSTEGLTYSKIDAMGLCLLLAGLFLFMLIKNRCICLRLALGGFLRPGCPGDYHLHRQSV